LRLPQPAHTKPRLFQSSTGLRSIAGGARGIGIEPWTAAIPATIYDQADAGPQRRRSASSRGRVRIHWLCDREGERRGGEAKRALIQFASQPFQWWGLNRGRGPSCGGGGAANSPAESSTPPRIDTAIVPAGRIYLGGSACTIGTQYRRARQCKARGRRSRRRP